MLRSALSEEREQAGLGAGSRGLQRSLDRTRRRARFGGCVSSMSLTALLMSRVDEGQLAARRVGRVRRRRRRRPAS
jgi:hypothetical protein